MCGNLKVPVLNINRFFVMAQWVLFSISNIFSLPLKVCGLCPFGRVSRPLHARISRWVCWCTLITHLKKIRSAFTWSKFNALWNIFSNFIYFVPHLTHFKFFFNVRNFIKVGSHNALVFGNICVQSKTVFYWLKSFVKKFCSVVLEMHCFSNIVYNFQTSKGA